MFLKHSAGVILFFLNIIILWWYLPCYIACISLFRYVDVSNDDALYVAHDIDVRQHHEMLVYMPIENDPLWLICNSHVQLFCTLNISFGRRVSVNIRTNKHKKKIKSNKFSITNVNCVWRQNNKHKWNINCLFTSSYFHQNEREKKSTRSSYSNYIVFDAQVIKFIVIVLAVFFYFLSLSLIL